VTEQGRPQKILMFGSASPNVCNACTLHLSGLANALQYKEAKVTFLFPRSGKQSEIRKMLSSEVKLIEFSCPKIPMIKRHIWTLGPIFALKEFLSLLFRERWDSVYIRAGLLTWILHFICRVRGVFSVSEHNGVIRDEIRLRTWGKSAGYFFLAWLQRMDGNFASCNRVVTKGMIQKLVQIGISERKIFVCGNATNLSENNIVTRKSALEAFGLSEKFFYIGFLGTLQWWQGVSFLLSAFALASQKRTEIRLLVGGDGPERASLERLAKELKINDLVHFVGHVNSDRRCQFISTFDIATLPAIRERNQDLGVSPIKIRDYLAMGRTVLASRLPGLEDLEAARAIHLHEPENIRTMAVEMQKLVDSPKLRAKLSCNGLKYAKKNYDWAETAQIILDVMEQGAFIDD